MPPTDPASETPERQLLDAAGVAAAIERLVDRILGAGGPKGDLAVVGIRRRGVPLAERIAAAIGERTARQIPVGILDITLYRDDLGAFQSPVVRETEVDFDVEGRRVLLVDDVLYTGRTIRAALDEIIDFGRPARIELAVLVDRGGRELPIQADYVGLAVEAASGEDVEVRLLETDGEDAVRVVRNPHPKPLSRGERGGGA